ncbi:Lon-like ATP-dependent protease [Nicoletella semolina]|uniref:endopeptidase La n=1 Tax=Nicoletella semolina TaxID=271160 RepID=A0A4R2N8W8_9PAST|nr:AAA family ATPase [Nicoletella semolina]MDH2924446.1 protease [Nicoletella semolina]TCP17430.1 Lon-like ATP-dependent protease [Nicoletella semolina]
MHISPLQWDSLIIEYPFSSSSKTHVNFIDFQPKAKLALDQFTVSELGSLLIIKTETLPEFIQEIENYLHISTIEPIIQNDFNLHSLFGYSVYLENESKIEHIEGIIEQANNRILILNLDCLLRDIQQWDKLKQALLFGEYMPNVINTIPTKLPKIKSAFKLILMGNRDHIAALSSYDNSLYQFAHYTEIDSYLNLNGNIEKWGEYIQTYAKKYGFTDSFSTNMLNQLLRVYIRESESRELISISPTKLRNYLLGIKAFYAVSQVSIQLNDIQDYFDYLESQSSKLYQYSLDEILQYQKYIQTENEKIGQINGLSVVEFEGVPNAFGEPLRISCNVQYGEGEINDIEHKTELGGNIHSKGVLIAQSCLANLLELPSQLPFSATVAFEQSYGEIDGDSSSLAVFCTIISALTMLPLPQSIAVTGAIDQFGNVLSVGGVTQKIEGFFQLCQTRGLTGKQGVIIPSVCISHLSLKAEVLLAVQQKKFQIWAVSDVFEAIQILLHHDFYDRENDDKGEKLSIFSLINQAIEQHQRDDTSGLFLKKICNFLRGN